MEEKFSNEGDYQIEEGYFKIVEAAYDLLENVKSFVLEDVIEESPTYEERNEIIHELSDILTRHSKIEKHKIENFGFTKANLRPIPPTSIKDDISMAENIKSPEQKIRLYEHAAESALINAGLFGNRAYINFGKKKYLEASEIWKSLGYPAESYIDRNLSKKFEYYALILNCVKANHIITQGEDMIDSTMVKIIKDLENYMLSQSRDKTRISSEEPYLQQLKKEESKKLLNVLHQGLEKKISLFEEKLMSYFDALRDAYVSKDGKFVDFCVGEIKREVVNELGKSSFSIFGWPKEQTKDNIARWINAYTGIKKLIKEYIPNSSPDN